MAPEDFLAYLKSSPLPGKNEWLRALIAKLGTRGLRAQKSQEFSAIVDIIRVVLGGRPTDFPLRHDGLSADRYIHALGDALHLEANTQERIRVQQHFLTHACGDDRLRSSGVRLLLAWSEDPDMAPGVVRFLGADPKERFLADVRLNARFWRVMASCKPALISKRTWPLRAAVQQAARSPGTAAGCIVSDGGVRGTVLAVAMYKASLEGITAGQIVNTLQARNGDGARIGSQLTPETLDCFLKEFQALLYHDSGITRDSSRDYLSDIYRRIARGALGSEYGARFRRYRARRLPVEKWLWVQSQVRSLFWQGQKKSG